MRLVLFDCFLELRSRFFPLSLGRPLWELRVGMDSLADKLVAKIQPDDIVYFVPDYMANAYRAQVDKPVNKMSALVGDDLILVNPVVKADSFKVPAKGASEIGLDEHRMVVYARISKSDVKRIASDDIETFIDSARAKLTNVTCKFPIWNYTWDLILANGEQIKADFAAAGRDGFEGSLEEPVALRGSRTDVYVAPGVKVHPMVTIDAEHGPVYIDQGAEILPFTRIEGPCYIGKDSILLGANCREGNSIGPCCRIGGEVEESIIHGYSNKYHDGFIGHSYIGEWVNLGALTTNSDLKNDYSNVSIMLDGQRAIDTGSTKVGSLVGDHTKTSIGTLLNTGSYLGAMAIIMATGKPLPKYIPSFAWFIEGIVTKGFGKGRLYETAKTAMSRRKREWTPAMEAMWDAVFEMTAPLRNKAIQKGRKMLVNKIE